MMKNRTKVIIILIGVIVLLFIILFIKTRSPENMLEDYVQSGKVPSDVTYYEVRYLIKKAEQIGFDKGEEIENLQNFVIAYFNQAETYEQWHIIRSLHYLIVIADSSHETRKFAYQIFREFELTEENHIVHVTGNLLDPRPEIASLYLSIAINQNLITEDMEKWILEEEERFVKGAKQNRLNDVIEWFEMKK